MIGIIDNQLGNLRSVENALHFLGVDCEVFSDPLQISRYSKLILPGVGAFGTAMDNLRVSGFQQAIEESVGAQRTPLLGICLGMQLLLERSTEHGNHEGLGLIKGTVEYIGTRTSNHHIPHIGWHELIINRESHLLADIPADEHVYYFVHSYYCLAAKSEESVASVDYGFMFDAVVESDNVYGTQFHPEKSQKCGLQILKNFASF